MMGRSPAVVAEREVRERGACTGGHGAWGGGGGVRWARIELQW